MRLESRRAVRFDIYEVASAMARARSPAELVDLWERCEKDRGLASAFAMAATVRIFRTCRQ